MKKSRIVLLVSTIFIFLFFSSFDFPRFRKQKPGHQRTHRYRIHSINHGQSYRIGEERYSPDRVLVKFNPSLSVKTIDSTIDAYQAKKIKRIPNLDIYTLEVSPHSTVEETVYALSMNPDVAHVSPDYKIYITAVPKPTDNFFNWQYALYNEGQEIGFFGPSGKSRADIKALEAWEETKGDDQVVIAVIDTGIDFNHPDLANTDDEEKILDNGHDFVNDDSDPSDDQGHGTFVSGLAAAKSNNGEGIAGVNWHSKILPLKVVDTDGSGYVSWLVDAIRYAVDNGANVISMSLGFSLGPDEEVPSLEEALNYAYARGLVAVASAGNEGADVLYPAAYDNCIAVAATDYNDSTPSWSNSGPEVDVAAPGLRIVGPVPTWVPELIWQDFTLPPYGFGDGTSASAAIVSGFVSLILSAKPWLEPDEVKDILRFSAEDTNASEHPGKDDHQGYGRVDMATAILALIITGSN
jgi:subtilisin family serine protease